MNSTDLVIRSGCGKGLLDFRPLPDLLRAASAAFGIIFVNFLLSAGVTRAGGLWYIFIYLFIFLTPGFLTI